MHSIALYVSNAWHEYQMHELLSGQCHFVVPSEAFFLLSDLQEPFLAGFPPCLHTNTSRIAFVIRLELLQAWHEL